MPEVELSGIDVKDDRPRRVQWIDGVIESVDDCDKSSAKPPYLSAGCIDIQINGFAGVNFGDPDLTTEQVLAIATRLWSTGVTHFLPTLITDDVATMSAAVRRIAQAAAAPELHGSILGIHLEGPYLSSEDGPRGAHPLEFCKDPDWDEFARIQESAGGLVKLVTLAPERPGSLKFIEQAVDQGIVVALGHTAAKRREILDAVKAGATLATHLGNAAHDRLQRHHNYIYDQLGEDSLMASLIVDGHHLPPHVVKIFLRAKGVDRIILTSDAVQYAGLEPGVYDGGYRQFEVREDGYVGVVGEPRMAGSGLLLIRGVENVVRFTGISLADAVRLATLNPARLLSLDDRLGSVEPGKQASLAAFEWDQTETRAEVVKTVCNGCVVFDRDRS